MNTAANASAATNEVRTVVVERDFPYPPAKLWRALTQPHLIESWLMKSDFAPVPGRHFQFHGDWGSVDCEVRTIEAERTLSYTWCAMGLDSVVTWTLEPSGAGTRLRMEQSGFRHDQEQAYQGARYGWQQLFAKLEGLLATEAP
jgi:uncharacterized protein YndB with AHSA1/START domain